jgi:methyl-accepting chemotaxis protein
MNAERRKRIAAIDAEGIKQAIETLKGLIDDARSEYEAIKDEEQEYYDNMPESFQQGDKGSKAEEIVSALESVSEALDEGDAALDSIVEALDNFEGTEL